MENHPIPQDVTGFQFKLIGNMTVKQFAYLATGIIIAWVFLQLPINLFIKIPISSVFAILGIGLAYVPISGRPMDLMIGNFIKALLRPTQFVYEKSGTPLYFSSRPTLMPHLPQQLKNIPVRQTVPAISNNVPAFVPQVSPTFSIPQINTIKATVFPQPISDMPKPTPAPPVVEQKKEAVQQTTIPTNLKPVPIPEFPNLITGVTKDPRGNILSNILVEVKDKEGSPVRAFKTNELGRFASATPLTNGVYTLEFEDPKDQNKFEPKTINVTGQIIMPIETTSIDTREELRRSLFSGSQ